MGIGLAAIQFIPTSQVTHYSVAKYRADWLGTGGGLYWQSLVSLVLPDHYHLFDLTQFKGPGDISFLYLYGSLAGLGLVIYCLLTRRDRYVSLLAIMMLFGGLWMLGDKTPIWRLLYPMLPDSVRIGLHPEYTYCNFTLPFAGLAALGLDGLRILERIRKPDLARWGIALVIAVDLFVVGSGRPMNCSYVMTEPGLTRESFDGSSDLLQTLRGIVNRDFPPARIDTMEASINWAECATLTRVPAANGSSPLALENVVRLQMMALRHPGVRWGWYYQVEDPDSPVLDIMNVKYLLVSSKAAEMLKTRPRFRHVASLPGNELFENLTVLPRYFLVSDVRQASDAESERLIRSGQIQLSQTALTEQDVHYSPCASKNGGVRTLAYEPNALELETDTACESFLVLSEAYYPGWNVWIDGRASEIHRTNLAFRGMVVPGGKHRIRMQFQPAIFNLSRLISAVTLALVAGMGFLGSRTIFPGRTDAGS